MNPLIVIVVFYGLLALALLLLRGDLTSWPVVADRILALVVSVAAVGWLVRGWSTRQPLTSPAGEGAGVLARCGCGGLVLRGWRRSFFWWRCHR